MNLDKMQTHLLMEEEERGQDRKQESQKGELYEDTSKEM